MPECRRQAHSNRGLVPILSVQRSEGGQHRKEIAKHASEVPRSTMLNSMVCQ